MENRCIKDIIRQEVIDLIEDDNSRVKFLTPHLPPRFEIRDESGMMLFRFILASSGYKVIYSYKRIDCYFRHKYKVNAKYINSIMNDIMLNNLNIKADIYCEDEMDSAIAEPTWNNPRYYNRKNIYSKVYIVRYSKGMYDDLKIVDLFVTESKYDAVQYRDKFNNILEKYKESYAPFEFEESGHTWIKKEFINTHLSKWNKITEINGCYFDELDFR